MTAPVPPQVVLAFGTAAITTLVGKVSISAAVNVAALRFGLDNVIVSVEVPAISMVVELKALPRVGTPNGRGGTYAAQVGTVIVFASVVTVVWKSRALPVKLVKCPSEIPAASKMFPTNALVAPIVVAPTGAQYTSASQEPPAMLKLVLASVVRAPPGLNI